MSQERCWASPGGGRYFPLVGPEDSQGQVFIMRGVEGPGAGPPLHRHTREDETFYILSGELTFWLDGQRVVRRAGESVFAPRMVPHTFKNCSSQTAEMLVICTPGGIGDFFRYGEYPPDAAVPTDEELVARIMTMAPEFGIEILGPSPL